MVGVSVLVGWNTLPFSYTVGLALGASLVSALFYALPSVYVRVTFQKTPALSLAIGQEIVAGFVMLPISAVVLPPRLPSLPTIAATIILALVMTGGGNLLYFYLINHIGPAKTQSVAFLVPVITVLTSAVFVGEPLTNGTLLGLSIILASVVLVTEVRLQIPRLPVVAALLRAADWGEQAQFHSRVPLHCLPALGHFADGLPPLRRCMIGIVLDDRAKKGIRSCAYNTHSQYPRQQARAAGWLSKGRAGAGMTVMNP